MTETNSRIIIDKLLRESDWVLSGDEGDVNVETELRNDAGFADYVLKDKNDYPLCVIEAKRELVSPLVGKEQARGYANSLGCRFIILSNGVTHYFWDIKQGSPTVIDIFPTQEQLEMRKEDFNPPRNEDEIIDKDYIASTQLPNFNTHPDYLDETKRNDFLQKNRLRILRDYQLTALQTVQSEIKKGNCLTR